MSPPQQQEQLDLTAIAAGKNSTLQEGVQAQRLRKRHAYLAIAQLVFLIQPQKSQFLSPSSIT